MNVLSSFTTLLKDLGSVKERLGCAGARLVVLDWNGTTGLTLGTMMTTYDSNYDNLWNRNVGTLQLRMVSSLDAAAASAELTRQLGGLQDRWVTGLLVVLHPLQNPHIKDVCNAMQCNVSKYVGLFVCMSAGMYASQDTIITVIYCECHVSQHIWGSGCVYAT